MKRISAAIMFIMALVASAYAQDAAPQQSGQEQLQLHSFKEAKSEGGLANVGVMFKKDEWPTDANGEDCAWVRVTFENMPMDDAEKVTFDFGQNVSVDKETGGEAAKVNEVWLFVSPANEATMEAKLDKYGTSNRLYNLKLESKHAYDVVLKNNKTMSITVTTKPAGVMVTLVKSGETKPTPATFTGVPLGKQAIKLSHNGQITDTIIEVADGNVAFDYDLRKSKTVKFMSDPSGADLYINGELVGRTPMSLPMRYDSYNVEARLSATESDSRSITVNDMSPTEMMLEPIKKKTFNVFAIYNGSNVVADLYVNGKLEGKGQKSYQQTLPIGKSYNMMMSCYGGSKSRKIKVKDDMELDQEFKISGRKSFTWPWEREYEAAPMGFSIGYVTKQWVTTGEGEQLKENIVWGGAYSKRLHGMQFGLHFQPCLSWGLGFYTGLFYEFYISSNEEYRDMGQYDNFVEHDMYLPVHAYYRLPFAEKIALSIHGGVGFDCGLMAKFTSTDYPDAEPNTDYYGLDYWPKRFNVSGEIGVSLRLGAVQLNFQYSKGLNDHESYSSLGNYKTVQNKISASISWVFQ